MIVVVKCYKHNVKPLVIEVNVSLVCLFVVNNIKSKFEGHDEQTQKDAFELAAILSRKNKCEYKVLVDLSYVAVINDSKIETNE